MRPSTRPALGLALVLCSSGVSAATVDIRRKMTDRYQIEF